MISPRELLQILTFLDRMCYEFHIQLQERVRKLLLRRICLVVLENHQNDMRNLDLIFICRIGLFDVVLFPRLCIAFGINIG